MKEEYLSKLDEVIKYYFGDNCELCYCIKSQDMVKFSKYFGWRQL